MLRPGGQATWVDGTGSPVAADTFTCSHCSKIVFCKASPQNHQPDVGGFCRVCYRHLCGPCADTGRCEPFEKKLEQMEARARFLNSVR